jgi:uncharacterized membrane protein HdeD (DUF308 family)
MAPYLARNWSVVLARGIAAVVFGLAVLFWPALTLLTFVYIFAIFVLVEGISAVVGGLRVADGGRRPWGLIAVGIIGIIAGIATFIWPGITGLILIYLIGFWAIAAGVVEIIDGIRLRREIANEWLLILTGVAALFFGLIVVVSPGAGALALAFLVGFFALVYGALQIILAFRLRSALEAGRP